MEKVLGSKHDNVNGDFLAIGTQAQTIRAKKCKKTKRRITPTEEQPPQSNKRRRSTSVPEENIETKPEATPLSSDENAALVKHPSILKKFQAVLRSVSTVSSEQAEPLTQPGEPHPQGLHPLPQPTSTKRSRPQLTLDSTLPLWLSNPTVIPQDHTVPFSDFPLSERLQNRIAHHLKFDRAFAVQAAILPLLLTDPSEQSFSIGHDILVSAPTGSGKTLSYILPILQDLSQRCVTRLRAIIIVPTRELVNQVRDNVESLASGLKVGIAWGGRSLILERTLLIKDHWERYSGRPDVFDEEYQEERRFSSKVDILICTPGRLVEHLTTSPGFHLRNLKWMVIDEADKLLAQSFQEWLATVMKALQSEVSNFDSRTQKFGDALGLRKCSNEMVRKVVLSATMTKDASKLAGLKLWKPKLVIIKEKPIGKTTDEMQEVWTIEPEGEERNIDNIPDEIFSVPSMLSEHYVSVKEVEDKPLYLVQLLKTENITSKTLVFTKGNESAVRLARLMNLMVEGLKIGLISGELNKTERKKRLAEFNRCEIDLYV